MKVDYKIIESICKWLQEEVTKANSKGVVFGLSGGVDSAVVAGVSKKAFPETSLGLIMPIHSCQVDEKDALLVAESLDLKTEKVDLSKVYDEFIDSSFDGQSLMAKSNLKPRLRMTCLYYYAQELGYLVLGCTNKSEYHIGYFTKWGDTGSDLMPLANFTKTQVYDMARMLEIPEKIIEKTPSAGLWYGQTDEEEIGFSYEMLDSAIEGNSIDERFSKLIDKKFNFSQHKRKMPLIYK